MQQAALQRVANLAAVRTRPDPTARLVGEVALTRSWFDQRHLDAEPHLQDLMWVQYRYMTLLQRTELFAREYVAAYRRAYGRHFDPIKVAMLRPLSTTLAGCSPDEINALAHARAHADALGMPYDIYCDTVMEGHLASDKWQRPPRPNQMYGKLAPPRLRGRPTREEVSARLFGDGWDSRFFAGGRSDDPIRRAALELMCKDVFAAPGRAQRLATYLVERRALTETEGRMLFGNDLVDEAIEFGGVPDGPVLWSSEAPTPSCYGFHKKADSMACQECPVRGGCADLVEAAGRELAATMGSDNPRLARKRQQGADRQRRHRDRRRAENAQRKAVAHGPYAAGDRRAIGSDDLDDFLKDL
ncbi:hypothetical protein DX912_07270 [Lysobacter soli]|uniref:Uncharacterized protein n=1 Tax=Lysobacter soli TaxID=453783 RepID=A0A3D8VEA5_9GAMM|nr:hypothetical protein DX912_07270 [Lysobacter soli]